jgi:hypothetical protein
MAYTRAERLGQMGCTSQAVSEEMQRLSDLTYVLAPERGNLQYRGLWDTEMLTRMVSWQVSTYHMRHQR